jgi:hypothetical protein
LTYHPDIEIELKKRKVNYLMHQEFSRKLDLLEKYADTNGVAVTFGRGNPHSVGCHMVVVTLFDDNQVEFYDNSKPLDKEGKPKIWKCNRSWFNQSWLGDSIVILGDNENADTK